MSAAVKIDYVAVYSAFESPELMSGGSIRIEKRFNENDKILMVKHIIRAYIGK